MSVVPWQQLKTSSENSDLGLQELQLCRGEGALDVQAEDAGCGPLSAAIQYLTLGESLYLSGF